MFWSQNSAESLSTWGSLSVVRQPRSCSPARPTSPSARSSLNAGIARPGTPLSAALDAARAELEVNYLGLIATTQAFAPVLAANGGGAFVNVLSVGSWIGSPILSTYSASKSAAWNFTNSARVELKRQGTHVVSVQVGFVDTDLTAALDVDKIAPDAVAAAALDAVQAGEPEAVVDDFSRQVK
ncbi:MAG: SDR family NAD(P)-dependent oxidoreductase, partial [Solirubrobacteraceae bacterium]